MTNVLRISLKELEKLGASPKIEDSAIQDNQNKIVRMSLDDLMADQKTTKLPTQKEQLPVVQKPMFESAIPFSPLSKQNKEAATDIAKSFGLGITSTAKGMAGAVEALKIPVVSDAVAGKVKGFTEKVEQKYLKLKNEDAFINKLAAGAGSAATFFIPGLGIQAGAARAALVAPRVAAYLGIGASGVLESATNAGFVFNEAKDRGLSDGDAQKAAAKTFVANLPVNLVLDKWMFNKLPNGKRFATSLKGAGQEGSQEAIQQVIQDIALNDPIILSNVAEAGAIGGIVGGGIGAILPSQKKTQFDQKESLGISYDAPIRGEIQSDQENKEGLPSDIGKRKTVIQTGPIQGSGAETPKAGGILQEPKVTVSEFDATVLDRMRNGIQSGTAGSRVPIADGGGGGFVGEKSTFPDWFQNKGFTKKESLSVIDKFKNGKPLTEKQGAVLARLYDEYKTSNEYLYDQYLESDFYDKINSKLSDYDSQSIRDFVEWSDQAPDFEIDTIDGIPITVKDIANAINYAKTTGSSQRIIEDAGDSQADIIPKTTGSKQQSENLAFAPTVDLSAKKWGVEMPLESQTTEKINKTQILKSIEKDFKIPIRGKVTQRWQKLKEGHFEIKQGLIRTRKWGELEVLSHELAHHIDYTHRKIAGKKWLDKNAPDLKELQSLDYDQVAKRTHEGFAEFMRYYLTTDKAHQMAPKFYNYFQNDFLENNPTLKTKIDSLKTKMKTWQEQGALNRTLAQIDMKGEHTDKPIIEKAQKSIKFLSNKFIDELAPIKKVTEEVERITGKKIKPSKNPFKLATYSKAKSLAVSRTFVLDKAVDESGNVVGPGLSEILVPVQKQEMPTFIAYASAKRAKNLSERGIETGFDSSDVDYILEKYNNPNWDKVADDITQWSSHLMDWMVRAGGLSSDAVQLMRDLNPVYLPFKRAFDDEIAVHKGMGGKVNSGQPVKKIKGSSRPIINPIEALITQAAEMINKAQKIRVASAIADLSENEGVGGFITRVPPPTDVTKVTPSQFKELMIKSGMIPKDRQSEARQLLDAAGEEGLMDMLSIFGTKSQYQGKDNIVMIWKNGQRQFYEVHPELYEALMGIDPIKLGPLVKIMSPFSRLLRLGATGLNVSFSIVRNPFRDFLGYAITSKTKRPTPLDPFVGAYKELKSQEGDLTWRFKKMGGAMSGQMGYDRAAGQAVYDEILRKNLGLQGKVLEIAKNPLNTMRDILSFFELAPRTSELTKRYEELKKEHPDWSDEDLFIESFNDAQDVTTNFTRGGSYGKQINEAVAFFNATIQGSNKAYRTIKDNPSRTAIRGLLWLTLPAMFFWYINKDEDWYRNLENAYKFTNFFIPISEKVILRLPIPFDLGTLFISTPVAGADAMYRKKPNELEGLLDAIKNMVPSIMPSLAQPIWDINTNKNFLGQPIETKGDQYKYVTERYRDNTMKISKLLSKGFDQIGVKLSPIQIDYLINNYTGGFVRQFGTEGGRVSNVPVFGSLFLAMPEKPKRQMNEFFSEYEVLAQKKSSDIITAQEQKRLTQLKPVYSSVRDKLKRVKKYQSEKRNDRVDAMYNELRIKLEKYGY